MYRRFSRFLIAVAAIALFSAFAIDRASAAGQYAKVVRTSYDQTLSVHEYHLANGLTILAKEVHAAPVVYFGVFYKVGSRDEMSGQTGLSHILEHMMFKGTRDLPPGSIARLFQRNGGSINAETGTDYTYYHELIASDRLELAVRVEADRMENSLFDPTQLQHEMRVVRSELEGDSNNPGWELYNDAFLPTAFASSPYHWPVIGWTSDVEAVSTRRDVIYKYYKEHYMPNNATVVIVGDFNPTAALATCQKYFGVYAPGNLEAHHITPEIVQHGERRIVLRRPGTTGEVLIGYHAPAIGQRAHYVLDVLSQILSSGRSGRLYQDLVQNQIAESASAGNEDKKDPYVFLLDGTDRTGVASATVEKALEDEADRLKTEPVTQDELQKAFHQIDADYIYANDTVSEQAENLGLYASVDDYHYMDNYLKVIHTVTPAEIQNVAKQVFDVDNRTVATFDPVPLPPGATIPPPFSHHFGLVTTAASAQQKAILDKLDQQFNGLATNLGKRPSPTRVVLPNGMTLVVEENHANKTVAMTGFLRAGSCFDPTGKWGLADVTAAMLSRGTTTKNALDLALTLENVGADASVSAGDTTADFGGQCLSKDFKLTVDTIADELRNPAFPQDELDRLVGESTSGLEEARQDAGGTGGPGTLAEIAFSQTLFPKGHPFWVPSIDDSEAALKGITVDDLRSFYGKYYRPDTASLVIVGDVNTSDAISTVKAAFADWQKPDSPAPVVDIPDVHLPSAAPSPQFISVPGTSQTSILWGFPGQLKRSDKDFYAATVMNFILGGSPLTARLGLKIRDQDGLAYTTESNFDATEGAGAFSVFVGTNPVNANHAIDDLKAIVKQVRDQGVSQQELKEAVDYLTGGYPLRLEGNSGVASQLLISQEFGLGLDYIQRRAAYYRGVTVGQVDAAAKAHLHPDVAALVVAGASPVSK
jgi:zinc protease